jgi:hypothetical protein
MPLNYTLENTSLLWFSKFKLIFSELIEGMFELESPGDLYGDLYGGISAV